MKERKDNIHGMSYNAREGSEVVSKKACREGLCIGDCMSKIDSFEWVNIKLWRFSLIAVWRYSSHTMQFSQSLQFNSFQCILQIYATISTVHLRIFSSSPKETCYILSIIALTLQLPSCHRQPLICFLFLWISLFRKFIIS